MFGAAQSRLQHGAGADDAADLVSVLEWLGRPCSWCLRGSGAGVAADAHCS